MECVRIERTFLLSGARADALSTADKAIAAAGRAMAGGDHANTPRVDRLVALSHLAPTLRRLGNEADALCGLHGALAARARGAPWAAWETKACDECSRGLTSAVYCCPPPPQGCGACDVCPACFDAGKARGCPRLQLRVTWLHSALSVARGCLPDSLPPPLAPPAPEQRLFGGTRVLVAEARDATTNFLHYVDTFSTPALLRGCGVLDRPLDELRQLDGRMRVKVRLFKRGRRQADSQLSVREVVAALSSNVHAGCDGGQVPDFPHDADFGEGASVAAVCPRWYGVFRSGFVVDVDMLQYLPTPLARPHMVQTYLAWCTGPGDSFTPMHCDKGGSARNHCLAQLSGPPAAVVAVWDLFAPQDAALIDSYLGKRGSVESGDAFLSDADVAELVRRGATHVRVEQREGDSVVVPVGCPHQVRNLLPSIKMACDYLGPWAIDQQLAFHAAMHAARPDDAWVLFYPEQVAIVAAYALTARV
jgi:hypothetical protein